MNGLERLIDAVRATKNPTEALVEDMRRAYQEAQGAAEAQAIARVAAVCAEFGIDQDALSADELAERLFIITREHTVFAPRFMVVTQYLAQQSAVHYDDPRAATFMVGLELVLQEPGGRFSAAFAVHGTPITFTDPPYSDGTPRAPFRAKAAPA